MTATEKKNRLAQKHLKTLQDNESDKQHCSLFASIFLLSSTACRGMPTAGAGSDWLQQKEYRITQPQPYPYSLQLSACLDSREHMIYHKLIPLLLNLVLLLTPHHAVRTEKFYHCLWMDTTSETSKGLQNLTLALDANTWQCTYSSFFKLAITQ